MKNILKFLIGIILLLIIIGIFLPSAAHVERTTLVKGNPEMVFKLINDLKEWEKWSPWHRKDPNMELIYGYKTEGLGAFYSWKSEQENVGHGTMTIKESKPTAYVKTEMNFMENGIASGTFSLKPLENSTEVKWAMDSDAGWNLVARYFGLMMDKFVGPDFEKGLHLLDSVAQTVKNEPFKFEIELGRIPAQKYMLIEAKNIPQEEVGKRLGEIYQKVGSAFKAAGLSSVGAPMAFFEEPINGTFTFQAGMPVDKKPIKKPAKGLIYKEMPASEAAIAHFSGPYEKTETAYGALQKFIEDRGKTAASMPLESYVSDPAESKTPLDIKTDIIWPVK